MYRELFSVCTLGQISLPPVSRVRAAFTRAREALRFEQACGRLVRCATDRGVVLCFCKPNDHGKRRQHVLDRFGVHSLGALGDVWPFAEEGSDA